MCGRRFISIGLMTCSAVLLSQTPADSPAFDVASIKPANIIGRAYSGFGGKLTYSRGRIYSRQITVKNLILEAYGLTAYQVAGGPSWVEDDHFEFDARAAGSPSEAQLREMLQSLLRQRCGLVAHFETKEMPIYEMRVSKRGIALQPLNEGGKQPSPQPSKPTSNAGIGPIVGNLSAKGTLKEMAQSLSTNPLIGRPVIDQTGVDGAYLIRVVWRLGEEPITVIQDVSGLKFESSRRAIPCLLIERVQRPTPN